MVFQRRTGFCGPGLELGIVPLLAIALEQIDGLLVHVFLVGMIEFGEVVALELAEIIEHAFV